MDSKNADLIIEFYKDVEKRLLKFTKYIPYNDENKSVMLPLLSSVIVEAGSLIDIIFREEFANNNRQKEKLNINDFAPYYEDKYRLSSLKTLLFIYPPSYIIPFESWIDSSGNYNSLSWWDNYNKLKHQRIECQNLSTLENALQTVCALHQIISQLPAFLDSLIRNDMVAHRTYSINIVKDELTKKDVELTVLIEDNLFATPLGCNNFPEDIKEISPLNFGNSNKLSRFLGRHY